MANPPLETVIEVFDKPFMLTGEYVDPRNLPYQKMLHGSFIRSNGDIVEKNWYISYNDQSGQFSGLAVRDTLTYMYDTSDRLVSITVVTKWFYADGSTGVGRDSITIYQ